MIHGTLCPLWQNYIRKRTMRNEFTVFAILSITTTLLLGYFIAPQWCWIFLRFVPLVGLGLYDLSQSRHAITRNFPINNYNA